MPFYQINDDLFATIVTDIKYEMNDDHIRLPYDAHNAFIVRKMSEFYDNFSTKDKGTISQDIFNAINHLRRMEIFHILAPSQTGDIKFDMRTCLSASILIILENYKKFTKTDLIAITSLLIQILKIVNIMYTLDSYKYTSEPGRFRYFVEHTCYILFDLIFTNSNQTFYETFKTHVPKNLSVIMDLLVMALCYDLDHHHSYILYLRSQDRLLLLSHKYALPLLVLSKTGRIGSIMSKPKEKISYDECDIIVQFKNTQFYCYSLHLKAQSSLFKHFSILFTSNRKMKYMTKIKKGSSK